MKSSRYIILLLSILLFMFSCDEEPQLDCAGVENGTATIDDCGLCTGGNTELVANYKKDCAGTCDGTAIEDECGVCEGDGPSNWPSDVAQIDIPAPSLTPIQPDLFWRGDLNDLPKLL